MCGIVRDTLDAAVGHPSVRDGQHDAAVRPAPTATQRQRVSAHDAARLHGTERFDAIVEGPQYRPRPGLGRIRDIGCAVWLHCLQAGQHLAFGRHYPDPLVMAVLALYRAEEVSGGILGLTDHVQVERDGHVAFAYLADDGVVRQRARTEPEGKTSALLQRII